MQTNPLL